MKSGNKDNKYESFVNIFMLLALGTGVGFLFEYLDIPMINEILVYILAIAIVAIRTSGKLYAMLAGVVAVVAFNYFFAEPQFSLVADPGYLITFGMMLLIAYILSSMSIMIKKAEEERVRLEEEAKREAFQANLLRAISHDLRTPLAGISGNANILLSHGDGLSDETKKQIFESIEDDSLWLNNLVENLLSISRMSNGQNMLTAQAEVIADLIDDAIKHVDRRNVDYNIKTHYEDEFMMVKADPRLIVQVVINIVNNAIKYTPEGSNIDIYTAKKDSMVEIRIEDNGPGLSETNLEKIFDQFFTEGKVKGDSRRGLGLGLYLCRSIVEAHEGRITAYNIEPHGAGFAITLPIAEMREYNE